MKIKVSALAQAILDMAENGQLKEFVDECSDNGRFVTMNKELIKSAKKRLRDSKPKQNAGAVAQAETIPPPPGVPIVDSPTCQAD